MCFTLVFIPAPINVLWRMNFSEHKYIAHANRMPPFFCHPLPCVSAVVVCRGESMFYTSPIYSYALSNCTNSYILSLIYVLWLLLIAFAFMLSRFSLSLHVCAVYFSIQTLLVWFLAASIEVYCSALDTFYNQKSLYDATHHFVLATFKRRRRWFVFICMYIFTLLRANTMIVSVWQPSMNDAKGSPSVIVCLSVAFCKRSTFRRWWLNLMGSHRFELVMLYGIEFTREIYQSLSCIDR